MAVPLRKYIDAASYRELRRLVQLHGAELIEFMVKEIASHEEAPPPRVEAARRVAMDELRAVVEQRMKEGKQ